MLLKSSQRPSEMGLSLIYQLKPFYYLDQSYLFKKEQKRLNSLPHSVYLKRDNGEGKKKKNNHQNASILGQLAWICFFDFSSQ